MAKKVSDIQRNALSELRLILKDELPPDMYENEDLLLKFLKARNFNVRQAESMIRKNLRWKKEIQLDIITTDSKPPEVLTKYLPASYIGFDKEGCPVRFIPIGKCDIRGVMKSINDNEFSNYLVQQIIEDVTTCESQSQKLGKFISAVNNIYDLSELSIEEIMQKRVLQNFTTSATIVQDNYPEMVKKIYIINASKYFAIIWPIIQKLLGPGLVQKISVYGQDGWKAELLKDIDSDVLPAFLGGKRTDPDGNPMCLTTVKHAAPVPEKYFFVKTADDFARKLGVTSTNINRQSRVKVPILITEPKSVINWEFEIKCYDIGFGLFLEKSNEKVNEELIPIHKMATEIHPCLGMYKCTKLGNYVMVFDNSYSWFHDKKVCYRTWITYSEGMEAGSV